MEVATTHRRWGYLGCCCAVLALCGCPQLLSDDFLLGRDDSRDAGLSDAGGAGGSAGQGGRASAGPGGGREPVDATAGDPADARALAETCNDGLRNQDETGIDCGGAVCTPCNCQFGPFHDVAQVDGIGSDDRFGPMLSADGTALYYSVQLSAGAEDIYWATRSAPGSAFGNPQKLGIDTDSLEGSPFVSRDNLALLFFSDRAGGLGNRDLWMATRASPSGDFAKPEFLEGVNSTAMELLPRLSYDGLTLMFESTRGGGSGSSDIWSAERPTPSGRFGMPRPRADLNTSGREEGFSLTADQRTIVIASNRGGTGMDLWIGTRSDAHATFGTLTALTELNSTEDELDPGISLDGREIFFTTKRDTDYRIYRAVRDCQ